MSDQSKAVPDKDYFSTGDVASHCAVTPNAVFKWVQNGKLPAERTAGGHFRISRDSLIIFLKGRQTRDIKQTQKKIFQYCWEFHSRFGKAQENCRKCVVFKSRASRCYELVKFADQIGHSKVYCTSSCDECDYYDMIHAERVSMLVITKRQEIEQIFRKHSEEFDCSLRFANSQYDCSRIIESYHPDYIIFDCNRKDAGFCQERCNIEFVRSISSDSRIPFTRLIVIGESEVCERNCSDKVFSYVDTPLSIKTMVRLVENN
ncbi:MAG: hypothetical protein GY865_04685 [candidate division Zixibacteria bacterium]|nr:hypothetical protein [candidate division Zixibacteria bacterium]